MTPKCKTFFNIIQNKKGGKAGRKGGGKQAHNLPTEPDEINKINP